MTSELDLHRIAQKVGDIKESLAVLREYAARKDEQFLANSEAVRSARYAFIVLIEAATNIAAHLCARLFHKAPASYAETFLVLAEQGCLDRDLAHRLAKMAGFRNLLVHRYADVDDSHMLRIMRNNLGDVEEYVKAVQRLVKVKKADAEKTK